MYFSSLLQEYADGGDLSEKVAIYKRSQRSAPGQPSAGMPEDEALNYFVQVGVPVSVIRIRLHPFLSSKLSKTGKTLHGPRVPIQLHLIMLLHRFPRVSLCRFVWL